MTTIHTPTPNGASCYLLQGRQDLRPLKEADKGLWCYTLQKEPYASRYPRGCLGYYLSDDDSPNSMRLCELDDAATDASAARNAVAAYAAAATRGLVERRPDGPNDARRSRAGGGAVERAPQDCKGGSPAGG